MHFSWRKTFYFNINFTEISSKESSEQKVQTSTSFCDPDSDVIISSRLSETASMESKMGFITVGIWQHKWDGSMYVTAWGKNILRPRQHGHHFANHIFKCIFLIQIVWF